MAGWSELIFGSMYSGKSEELIRRIKRAQIAGLHCQVFKPSKDNRYENISTHEHNSIKAKIKNHINMKIDSSLLDELNQYINKAINGTIIAESVNDPKEILTKLDSNTKVVGIDEIQFFEVDILPIIEELKKRNIRVIIAGLDMYASGFPFGETVKTLACTSKYVDKLHAVCVECGRDAYCSHKLDGSDPSKIDLGSTGKYVALCESCIEKKEN